MSQENNSFERIAENVKTSFHDFARKRSPLDPNFLRRIADAARWQAQLARLFAFVPGAGRPIRGKKYLFLSARHGHLVSSFRRDEAAIIGGPSDFSLARKTKLPFRFTGDLLAASSSMLFGMQFVPTRWIVRRWLGFFARQQDPCYLVVPSDTLPIALLLVKIAEQCPNVTVVCVQHGLFNSGFDADDIEGRNSAINLVYCDAQRREMERRLHGALVEVMGFPAEFRREPAQAQQVQTAILVGNGTLDSTTSRYRRSLQIFDSVQATLERAGLSVEYRPHPSEHGIPAAQIAFRMNRQSKDELLVGDRKAFIGFTSTLLYEAHLAGHVAVVLHDAALPGYAMSDFGLKVDTSAMDTLPELIARTSERESIGDSGLTPVRPRFEAALARATARITTAP